MDCAKMMKDSREIIVFAHEIDDRSKKHVPWERVSNVPIVIVQSTLPPWTPRRSERISNIIGMMILRSSAMNMSAVADPKVSLREIRSFPSSSNEKADPRIVTY